MSAPANEIKDIVRLQFDVRRAQFNIIENLVEVCGLSSKKELFSNAMALLKWAVQETQKGRRIASYDPERDEIEMVALPALDLIAKPDVAELNDTECNNMSHSEKSAHTIATVGRPRLVG